MAFETITVRKKSNHAITRNIQPQALKTFQKRGWEQVIGGQAAPAPVVKKNPVVEPVAELGEAVVNVVSEVTAGPFANVDSVPGEITESSETSIESLREEYQIISGQKADKRWNEKRLKMEIEKASESKGTTE